MEHGWVHAGMAVDGGAGRRPDGGVSTICHTATEASHAGRALLRVSDEVSSRGALLGQ